jgi:hypothetical protein
MTRISQAIRCIKQYSTEINKETTKRLIYTSPNVGLVKLVKKFSLTTLGVSFFFVLAKKN